MIRIFILKLLGFIAANVLLVVLEMYIFRSAFPMWWMTLALLHVMALILFPYSLLKIKSNEEN